jgi:hypothetical protein
MPVQRLSAESQCSTDSCLSYDNVASRLPISIHSFDWQPIKDTATTVEEVIAKLEAIIVRSLNSADGDSELSQQRMAAE